MCNFLMNKVQLTIIDTREFAILRKKHYLCARNIYKPMKKLSTDISPRVAALIGAVLTLLLWCRLQWTQEYRFYAKEAEHLWLNDALWLTGWLKTPGGMSQLMMSGLQQFFGLWGVGALTMSVLAMTVAACGYVMHRQLKGNRGLDLWWLVPVALLTLCHENGYYNLRGTLAVALAMGAGCLYGRRPSLWLSLLLTGLVYWMAGSAAVLLAVVIATLEALQQRRLWNMILPVLLALTAAGMGVRYGVWISMEEALTPAQYYEWPSTYFIPLYAWICVPLLLVAGRLLPLKWKRVLAYVGICLIVNIDVLMRNAIHNPNIYLLRQDEWRASQEDWDGIIEAHRGVDRPTPLISYLNLALAQKGQLVERMGEFHPYIAWSDEAQMYSPVLMTQNELSRDALKLQSCVCMAWGGSALCNAQKAAYEANFLTPGDTDPVELQRLVLTNYLLETPRTAQKYLRRLSRTTMHHAWADQMLQHPELLEAEAERLRMALPDSDAFYMKTQVVKTLRDVAMRCPENRVAAQFYETYLIQSRDSVGLRKWNEVKRERQQQPRGNNSNR